MKDNRFLLPRVPRINRISRIVNRYERRTLSIIESVVKRYDMAVCQKLRIADALPIYRSGLSEILYTYALTSHFDFIITFDHKAVIAIEFDGPGHLSPTSIANDQKKSDICNFFGLPFFRIDTQYLRTLGHSTILEYVLDEILTRVKVEYMSTLPIFSFEETTLIPEVSELLLPYDVKQFRINAKPYLDSLFKSKKHDLENPSFAAISALNKSGDLYFSTRLAKSADQFYNSAALTILDDDTAILGVGSCFKNDTIPLDAPFLSVAFALIDALDLIRMFDESDYKGLTAQHAVEFLNHFQQYASEAGAGRFLSLGPLCEELTQDWLNQ